LVISLSSCVSGPSYKKKAICQGYERDGLYYLIIFTSVVDLRWVGTVVAMSEVSPIHWHRVRSCISHVDKFVTSFK